MVISSSRGFQWSIRLLETQAISELRKAKDRVQPITAIDKTQDEHPFCGLSGPSLTGGFRAQWVGFRSFPVVARGRAVLEEPDTQSDLWASTTLRDEYRRAEFRRLHQFG